MTAATGSGLPPAEAGDERGQDAPEHAEEAAARLRQEQRVGEHRQGHHP